METFLHRKEDLYWLYEVHLKECITPPFTCAIVSGREDWPDKITLYEKNHYQSKKLELLPDAEGNFHCNQTSW